MKNWRRISARERGEIESREFLTDEVWIAWKQDYDSLMSYRKSFKGKPTEEQLSQIAVNKIRIGFYEAVLFHSPFLAHSGNCVCARCKNKG